MCQLQVEMKRFFAMLKQWRHIDRAWTLEFLSLDVWMRGGNKANINENTGQAGLAAFFSPFHLEFSQVCVDCCKAKSKAKVRPYRDRIACCCCGIKIDQVFPFHGSR